MEDSIRRRGTVYWFDDKEGYGFITPDNTNNGKVFVHNSSLRIRLERPLCAGDWVEYSVVTRDFEPRVKAIDLVPVSFFCTACGGFDHLWPTCRHSFRLNGQFSRVTCLNCGKLGHHTSLCCKRDEPIIDALSDTKLGLLGNPPSSVSSSRVEPPMVSVKRKEDVKNVEQFQDCFILDFDPYEPPDLSGLSLFDKDDVLILAEKGQVACRDYPHSRHLCATHQFHNTSHNLYCQMCYCYICEKPAPCKKWNLFGSMLDHCNATDDLFWKMIKELGVLRHVDSILPVHSSSRPGGRGYSLF